MDRGKGTECLHRTQAHSHAENGKELGNRVRSRMGRALLKSSRKEDFLLTASS